MLRTAVLLILLLPCAVHADWWDGFAAPPAGEGLDGQPRALHVHDGEVFAGGSFLTAGGDTTRFIARWDGADWHDVGGGANNRIDAMATYDGGLIAGGRFTRIGGADIAYVAAWDGAAWSAVGADSWPGGYVMALAVDGKTLYAAGTGYVAVWDGLVWQRITGSGFTGDVFALAYQDDTLYAGGAFSSIVEFSGGAVDADNVAAWNGETWSALGDGTDGTVYALEPWDDVLVAGGVFGEPGDLVAAWNGGSWYAPGDGLTGSYVIALCAWSGHLVVGGDFSVGGGLALTRIGVLYGGDWSPLDDGLNGMVRALAARGHEVYAGGAFTLAGETPSRYVARWDDTEVGADDPSPVAAPRLAPPYPNPANPGLTIPLELAADAHLDLDIYDLHGRRVRTLWRGELPSGRRVFRWDGRDDDGRALPSGAYFARVRTSESAASRRVVLVR